MLKCPVVIMCGFMVVVLHKFLTLVPHTFQKLDILNLPFEYLEAFI